MVVRSDHSTFGGSGAERWAQCPGSIGLAAQVGNPPSESEYATEGTRAHAVAERILTGWTPPLGEDPEMVHHAYTYAAGVNVYRELYGAPQIRVELKVISKFHRGVGGTIDALLVAHKSKTVIVIDYKYGAGVSVSPADNAQLKFYAMLALESLEEDHPDIWSYNVIMAIFQPRGADTGWKEWALPGRLLDLHRTHTYGRIQAIKLGAADLNPGKHCRWCEAQAVCPKFAEEYVEPFFPLTPIDQLSNAQIYDLYRKGESLSQYLKSLEAYIKTQCQVFGTFESYTLARGRGQTKFLNPIAIQAEYPQDQYPAFYTPPQLKTPKQILELHPELKRDLEGCYTQVTYDKLITNEHRDYTDMLDDE